MSAQVACRCGGLMNPVGYGPVAVGQTDSGREFAVVRFACSNCGNTVEVTVMQPGGNDAR